MELLKTNSKLALQFDLAIREYIGSTVRPILEKYVDKNEFIPEAMSTSFVARKIFEKVKKQFPDYIIKFSSDNPRNPVNQAGPEELKMIQYFKEHPESKRWFGKIMISGKQYQAAFFPRKMEKSCLSCHGEPGDAPKSLIKKYGDKRGFHRRVGDIIAMDTIAIPLQNYKAAAVKDMFINSLIIILGICFLLAAVYVVFYYLVASKLKEISSHFKKSAENQETWQFSPIEYKGDDEIGVLVKGFNALNKRLKSLYETLEERVSSRTKKLQEINTDLQHEIAERKQLTVELKKAMKEAGAANVAKSEFLATMSHEIRTPMNAIIGMTSLLLNTTKLTTEQQEYAEIVENSSKSLLGLINDILDFSKIEAGKIEFEKTDFNIRSIMEEIVDMLNVKAGQKGLALNLLIEPGVPELLLGDPFRLRQVVTNIAANAIKFTDQGEVTIRIKSEDEKQKSMRLLFEISDTGIGIPEDKLQDLFSPFTQVDNSITRKYGGTGLGLAIVKRIIDSLDGEIGLESTPGKGSTFYFRIEFEKQGIKSP